MASVLDLGLLQYFEVIFPVILIFVLVFSMLSKFKLLGESTPINATVAICCAFLAALSESVIALIIFVAPWFVLVFVLLLLFLLIMKTFGTSDEDIMKVVTRDAAVTWTILGIAIVIIGAGFAVTFGEDIASISEDGSSTESDDFQTSLLEIIFHPKILGVLILFTICVMAIALLTGKQ